MTGKRVGTAFSRTIIPALLMPILSTAFLFLSFAVALLFEGSTTYQVAIEEDSRGLVDGLRGTVRQFGIELVDAKPGRLELISDCGSDPIVLHFQSPAYRFGSHGDLEREITRSAIEACSGVRMQFQQGSERFRWARGWLFLLMLLGMSILLTFLYRRQDQPDKVKATSFAVVGPGLLAACVILAINTHLLGWENTGNFITDSPSLSLFQLIAVCVFVPYLEELGFRAGFIPSAERVLPWWAAVVLSAALFAVIHWGSRPELLMFYFSAGLVLALLWQWRKSLLACVVAHGGYNLAISLASWPLA